MAPGLLLIRADLNAARTWARRGLVSVCLTPLGSWTAVILADVSARTAPPYDDGLAALAARPVGARLRPCVGFFVADEVATITVRGQGWRDLQRWAMWTPRRGVHHPEHLAPLRPGDLAEISGGVVGARGVDERLHSAAPDGLSWLRGVHRVLQLPGADLMTGGVAERGELVDPAARSVAQFDALMAEDHAHQRDVGGEA